MDQFQETLLNAPNLTNLTVQLIADTTSADKTSLPAPITTEIRYLKVVFAEKSIITFNHTEMLFGWMSKLKKSTSEAAKGETFIRGE